MSFGLTRVGRAMRWGDGLGQAAIGSWNSMAAMGIAESVCRLSLGMGLNNYLVFSIFQGAWALSTKTFNNN